MVVWNWITLLVFLLTMWIAVTRELKNALLGYLLQTALVAALYAVDAVNAHDMGMWIAFAGLIVIRGMIVPGLIWSRIPRADQVARSNRHLVTPTWALFALLFVSLAAALVAASWHTDNALRLGFALATLLTGITITALSNDPRRQIVGLLCSEGGVDLAIATILSRIPVGGDYVVFIDIALAVLLFVVLMRRYANTGSFTLDDYHRLRG